MILVRNRRLPLSGSNLIFAILFAGLIWGACSPKVLRPGGGKDVKKPSKEKEEERRDIEEEVEATETLNFNNIALLLPFQLDKVIDSMPNRKDVERSSLALDFYQGFKLGLDRLTSGGDNFKLNVLDTRDNAGEAQRLAVGQDVKDAQLVVGPVFPTEINAFSKAANLKGKLQISPLAASDPSQYNIGNLVTVTPPIEVHAQAIAKYIAAEYSVGEQIIIVDNDDEDSKKFLLPLKNTLNKLNISFKEVKEIEDFELSLAVSTANIVINASTNQFFVAPLVAELYTQKTENAYDISLVGHPNWVRLDLDPNYLSTLNTCISSSYYVNDNDAEVKSFKKLYGDLFKVIPTDFAYKGYDAGLFFGRLLAEHPEDYADHLIKEAHDGVSMGFDFNYTPNAGYVNHHIRLLRFDGERYRPL
ncbi:amino acid ABC transporter substrate-binding protein [Olivibacter sp. SDN3]|uniref:ABC transporter substrate-binding protein n=1 Tax=Olivibacter sp. SDN3 TaxID=2764720 RepID=UPI00165148D8|nr:ABC transporter substrate-binding protein [Olivibacter sp. SDN3]QNL52149.1 amino acid ABC transporter substrate-binding protein [Olivibacter sp. SDN3]